MSIFDIFIAYVSWDSSGKYRPVTVRDLPKVVWNGKIPVGKLTDTDIQRLFEFLTR